MPICQWRQVRVAINQPLYSCHHSSLPALPRPAGHQQGGKGCPHDVPQHLVSHHRRTGTTLTLVRPAPQSSVAPCVSLQADRIDKRPLSVIALYHVYTSVPKLPRVCAVTPCHAFHDCKVSSKQEHHVDACSASQVPSADRLWRSLTRVGRLEQWNALRFPHGHSAATRISATRSAENQLHVRWVIS